MAKEAQELTWTVDGLAHLDRLSEERHALVAAEVTRVLAIIEEREALFRSEITQLHGLIDERDLRYQAHFDAQEQAMRDALLAAENAVLKAERATEKRFDAVNEFRGQMADQASMFMPRGETQVLIAALNDKIDSYEKQVTAVATIFASEGGRAQGMGETARLVAGIIAVIGTLVAIGSVIIAVISRSS